MPLATCLASKNIGPFKLAILIGLIVAALGQWSWSQTLLKELTTDGVEFQSGMKVVLPPPTLSGPITDEQLDKAKSQLSGNDGWDKFARDSVVAPVTIKLEYVTDKEGARVGHNVHSAFVVHTKLESLADKDLMQQIFGKPESAESSGMKFVEIAEPDLKAAGIEAPVSDEKAETKLSYSQVEFTLLEKIRLSGVMRIERTATPDSITICWLLDPKFAKHDKLQGTWVKTGSDTSEAKPYSGWGGYLNVTRVSQSPETLVIESRMLLHELPEWFSASNFVRSKLPLAIQEGARNFRRKLK